MSPRKPRRTMRRPADPGRSTGWSLGSRVKCGVGCVCTSNAGVPRSKVRVKVSPEATAEAIGGGAASLPPGGGGSGRGGTEQAPHLGRDLYVLPRPDHQGPHGSAAGADVGVQTELVATVVELDSEEAEPGRRRLAHGRRVLADAAGEDE